MPDQHKREVSAFQVSPVEAAHPTEPPDPWPTALAEAAARLGDGAGALLFHERRVDLVVEQALPLAFPPVIDATRQSGLAARSGAFEREVCRGEATLDDIEPLVDLVLRDESPPRRTDVGSVSANATAEEPSIREALALVAAVARAVAEASPGCAGNVRLVELDQRVVTARPGRAPAADRRRGRRVRVEAGWAASPLRAVAERSLHRPQPIAGTAEALASEVAARLAVLRDVAEAEGGSLPVVFAPGAGGVVIHELVGHALEADTVAAGRSWLAAGTTEVAARDVRVVDDPRRGRVAWHTDDEGEPARATALLRDGRVASQLHDLRSAWLARRQPTGHGRRSSHAEPVRPRMGCTFLAGGTCAPEETIASVERGVYVRRLEAGSVDTLRGVALFRVTDADRIIDGRLERPLAPFLLEVRGAVALRTLEMIATDLELDACIGSCVREGQPLSTSVGAPTFRIGVATVCR
jgi:predicted Zn-dependent protease